jgi:cytochrome o ubiquinol oxidase subunit I
MVICVLSFIVWLHHFFTMGAGADVNAFFGIATMIIAVPTGVKIFNWLFTLYGGRVRFTVPIYWTLGFMVTFVIGGMSGVLMAIPPADFVLHNSLFLVAHFHNVAIGGVVFGVMAGITYWFPKAFGFTLNERLGKAVFWCWFVGFYLAFMPLYVLGLMGATRRLQHYSDLQWQPLMIVALAGAVVILIGIALTVVQIAVSIRQRHANRDVAGDPWNGRTLEWSIPSPPPAWNFAELPRVEQVDAYWNMKREGTQRRALPRSYVNLHLPRNTPVGFFLAFFAVISGFALIWRIDWLAAVGLLGAVAVALRESWRTDREVLVPAHEVAAFDEAHGVPGQFVAPTRDLDAPGEISRHGTPVAVQTGVQS